jgi:hypothetical protein
MPFRWMSFTAVLMPLAVLAACDDPQAANAENFRAVLQAYYDDHLVCLALPLRWPIRISSSSSDLDRRQVDALLVAELLAPATATETLPPNAVRSDTAKHFSPTAASATALRPAANQFIGGTDLCFARREIVRIDSFTTPAATVSRVTYGYRVKDVASWATLEPIQTAFPRIRTMLAEPNGTGTDSLVLTSTGWMHQRMMR